MRGLGLHRGWIGVALALLLYFGLAAPAAARADEVDAGERAMESAARHAVVVLIRFQRDIDAETRGALPPDPRGMPARYRYSRRSQIVPGFVLGDRRTVVVSDLWVSLGAVETITLRARDGTEVLGHLHAFLPGVEGALVRTTKDLPVEPLTFEAAAEGPPRYAASVMEGAVGFETWVEDLDDVRRRPWRSREGPIGAGRPSALYGGLERGNDDSRAIDLVCDVTGAPLGFRFGARVDPDGRWRGRAILAAEAVTMDRLRKLEDAASKASVLHRLTVTFRTLSRHDRERDPFDFASRGTAEEEFWGLAITPNALVVPENLDKEKVRRILSIRLEDADVGEEEVTVSYGGRLRGYHAFLVRAQGANLTCLPAEAPPAPEAGSALLVHRVAYRGGMRRDQVDYDRVLGWGPGYGDRRLLSTERSIDEGALLRGLDGDVLGFSARLDPEDRERRIGEGRRMSSVRRAFPIAAVLFDEVGLPAVLAEDPDTRVMPQEKEEARRSPWLGVEYTGLDEGLAELLEISESTRDGQRGLVVTVVYANSPAAKAGIETDDVLLSARRTSAPGGPPIDLKDSEGGGGMYFPGMFGGPGPAPWRARTTGLVQLLKDWGEGTTWELVYLHNKETKRGTFTVEVAPPDFTSAPRHFDEGAGIEVRDLTYEVRRVLRIGAEAPGVVVARTEPGGPAAQARIEPNELILEFDGRGVSSAKALGTMLEAARVKGRDQVRLVVERLGKTRIVDLRVEADPTEAPGDGSEEDGR